MVCGVYTTVETSVWNALKVQIFALLWVNRLLFCCRDSLSHCAISIQFQCYTVAFDCKLYTRSSAIQKRRNQMHGFGRNSPHNAPLLSTRCDQNKQHLCTSTMIRCILLTKFPQFSYKLYRLQMENESKQKCKIHTLSILFMHCTNTHTSAYLWFLVVSIIEKENLSRYRAACSMPTDQHWIRQIFRWFGWKRLMEWKEVNKDWMKEKNKRNKKNLFDLFDAPIHMSVPCICVWYRRLEVFFSSTVPTTLTSIAFSTVYMLHIRCGNKFIVVVAFLTFESKHGIFAAFFFVDVLNANENSVQCLLQPENTLWLCTSWYHFISYLLLIFITHFWIFFFRILSMGGSSFENAPSNC